MQEGLERTKNALQVLKIYNFLQAKSPKLLSKYLFQITKYFSSFLLQQCILPSEDTQFQD